MTIAALVLMGVLGQTRAEEEPAQGRFFVRSAQLAVELSARGEIVGATLGQKRIEKALRAGTRLAGFRVEIGIQSRAVAGGGVEFTKRLTDEKTGRQCVLVERFLPTADSVRWEIEIRGQGEPWSAPIKTHVFWPDAVRAKFWTAWGDSRSIEAAGRGWDDPLVPVHFDDREFVYGGFHWLKGRAFCLPLVTVLEERDDIGMSLILSPEDLILAMKLNVTGEGQIVFTRTNHRITQDRSVHFAMDLVAHAADWRAGLGWMTQRYRPFFDPPNPLAHELAGCGAYSSHAENFDAERLKKMAFRVNWKASYDFPYMGMFLPPVRSDTEEWIDFKQQKNSISQLRAHSQRMREMGFYVLNYFNVTEFGAHIQHPPPARKTKTDADLWEDSNDFLYGKLSDAIVPGPEGKPIPSWEGCVVMDAGEPVYQQHLLAQARQHIEKLPESAGICIDRMDWVAARNIYNRRRNDGVSWSDGKPSRSLVTSWHDIMSKLGPMMHDAGKVIFCNPCGQRIDLLRHLDGVYDEFGQYPHSLSLSSLLCVRKPLMAWTVDPEGLRGVKDIREDPDGYFQRHLYLGSYLTAPLAGNDHTILPSAWADKYYFDYGPLLDAMRGKKWVLLPHVVEVACQEAKANLFEVPGGFVIPVVFGGDSSVVRIRLRHLPRVMGQDAFRVEVIHPGSQLWTSLPVAECSGLLTLDVPLLRGCAMVKLSHR